MNPTLRAAIVRARRYVVLGVVGGRVASLGSAGCASPLTVAEERDAEAGQFTPTTPNDGARDALDEPVSLGDPTDAGDGG